MEGRVPLEAKDENGESMMALVDIYAVHPEHAEYHYLKFSRQLSSVRKTLEELNDRAERKITKILPPTYAIILHHLSCTMGIFNDRDPRHKSY
jgi:hypothetical protein